MRQERLTFFVGLALGAAGALLFLCLGAIIVVPLPAPEPEPWFPER
jgi:hypothetical protein